MTQDGQALRKLLDIFRTELREQLDIISDGLVRLEKRDPDQVADLNACMRAAHNVKGGAGSIGIPLLGDIAHRLESIFEALGKGTREPSSELVDLCFGALDQIREIMTAFQESRPPGIDVGRVLANLDLALAPADGEPQPIAPQTPPPPPSPPVSQSARATSEPAAPPLAGKGDSVRVAVAKLDALAATVEELQIAKMGIEDQGAMMRELRRRLEAAAELGEQTWRHAPSRDTAQLQAQYRQAMNDVILVARQMDRTLRSRIGGLSDLAAALQDATRSIRMVAVSTMVPQLVRMARDLGRDLGKRVDFQVEGEDTEMDRAVLDLLRDPLVHLIRNAVDHGIEIPEDRRAAAKPEIGRIHLGVDLRGDRIVVTLEDDGRGIDADLLVRTAIRKSLLTEEDGKRLGRSQVLDLIFQPGFSTRDMAGDVSGRGIGLDVVRANLLRMNGSVQVETHSGQGTTFTLHVPLTLTAEHALLVRVAAQSFALPINGVERVLHVAAEEIADIGGGQVVLLDDQPLPLRSLAAVLGLEASRTTSIRIPIIVLSAGEWSVAFTVDEIVGFQEIVIKPLGALLTAVPNVIGGTLTGRGGVVLVLDPRDIAHSALRAGGGGRPIKHEQGATVLPRRILVVDDSLTSRALQKNILECNGYRVETAAEGLAGWQAIQSGSFDLVITDVDMPVMDGFELTEKIKRSDRFKDTPVIIVTSLDKESDRQRGLAIGADAYVVKSQFDSRILIDITQQLIA